ncbi:hypothetical protein [Leptospira levettii]|uniref:hypothetical protein n=1 Tax=Leptospira levettii TaxID=2023178 RepID=UPI00143826BC|nr:hypothetical protein [Leptospira levettii]
MEIPKLDLINIVILILLLYIIQKLRNSFFGKREEKLQVSNPFRLRGKIELSELNKLLSEISEVIFKLEQSEKINVKIFLARIKELISVIPALSPYDSPPKINFDEEVPPEDLNLLKIYISSKKDLIEERLKIIEKKGDGKNVDENSEGSLYSLELILRYFNNHISRLEEEISNLKFYSYVSGFIGTILLIIGIVIMSLNSNTLINHLEEGSIYEYSNFQNSLYVFTRYFLPLFSKGILVVLLEYLSIFFLKSFFDSRKQEKYYYDKISEANFKMYALLATYYTENASIFQEVLKELISKENFHSKEN